MRHLKAFLILLSAAVFITACEKHVIEYEAETISPGSAEFQLHYFNPVTTGAANNIYKVEINNQLYVGPSGVLSTYNAAPAGAVGRFFNAPAGNTNIKMYKGSAMELVYDKNVNLTAGKQNVFVHDFDEAPIVIDNGFPYPRNVTADTDKSGWVRFVNMLYETPGVPTDKRLQYQFQYVMDRGTMEKSEWLNVGSPVAFGEATVFQEIPVIKEIVDAATSSYARIDYRIVVIGADGSDQGLLQVRNTAGNFVNYSDWWNCYVGRHYMHIFAGFRADSPTSSVRQFTSN